MQMKPNAKDNTSRTKFAVHFEVTNVVNCNKMNFYIKIGNFSTGGENFFININ